LKLCVEEGGLVMGEERRRGEWTEVESAVVKTVGDVGGEGQDSVMLWYSHRD
jgi:hypothetical protein